MNTQLTVSWSYNIGLRNSFFFKNPKPSLVSSHWTMLAPIPRVMLANHCSEGRKPMMGSDCPLSWCKQCCCRRLNFQSNVTEWRVGRKINPVSSVSQIQDTTVWAVVTKKDSWGKLLDHGTEWSKGLQGYSEHRKIKASHFLRKFVNPNNFGSISSFNIIATIQSLKKNTVCASP